MANCVSYRNIKIRLIYSFIGNSKLSFLQAAYFSLILSFMEYDAAVWNPYHKYSIAKVERGAV